VPSPTRGHQRSRWYRAILSVPSKSTKLRRVRWTRRVPPVPGDALDDLETFRHPKTPSSFANDSSIVMTLDLRGTPTSEEAVVPSPTRGHQRSRWYRAILSVPSKSAKLRRVRWTRQVPPVPGDTLDDFETFRHPKTPSSSAGDQSIVDDPASSSKQQHPKISLFPVQRGDTNFPVVSGDTFSSFESRRLRRVHWISQVLQYHVMQYHSSWCFNIRKRCYTTRFSVHH
jgi:hypothetical protein